MHPYVVKSFACRQVGRLLLRNRLDLHFEGLARTDRCQSRFEVSDQRLMYTDEVQAIVESCFNGGDQLGA